MPKRLLPVCFALVLAACSEETLQPTSLRVATATNFLTAAQSLETAYEAKFQRQVTIVPGATGLLVRQIEQRAPFDLFLAADETSAKRFETAELSTFPYAVGRLVLWSERVRVQLSDLSALEGRIAVPNPETAPYGKAAVQVLKTSQLWSQIEQRLVYGSSAAQVVQMVQSGAAEVCFCAEGQVRELTGFLGAVSPDLHEPILQLGVPLRKGTDVDHFIEFLTSPEGQLIIATAGYDLP